MNSVFRSPPRDGEDPRSPLRGGVALPLPLPPPPHNTPVNPAALPPPPRPPSPAAAIVNFSAREGRAAEARVDGGTARSVAGIARRGSSRTAAVWARAAAAALCLVAFSVMAADKNKGWAVDSFGNYKEYRFCLTVNVLGFLYAVFQAYAEVRYTTSGKHIIHRPMGFYFDFAMDQIFAYLLISAASSATTRTNEWVSNWGADPFPSMARGSIAISYLAFVTFAFSSLISAYNLFKPSI